MKEFYQAKFEVHIKVDETRKYFTTKRGAFKLNDENILDNKKAETTEMKPKGLKLTEGKINYKE